MKEQLKTKIYITNCTQEKPLLKSVHIYSNTNCQCQSAVYSYTVIVKANLLHPMILSGSINCILLYCLSQGRFAVSSDIVVAAVYFYAVTARSNLSYPPILSVPICCILSIFYIINQYCRL